MHHSRKIDEQIAELALEAGLTGARSREESAAPA
jgi:hypothetical protein